MSQLPLFKNNEIFSSPVRLLIKESHVIFTSIPRNNTELSKSNVINISRRYRSIVHECVENLTRDQIISDNSKQIQTFRELEVIWNLCEILLLDVDQAGTLIIQLKNWIKMHFEEVDPKAKDILRSLDNANFVFTHDDISESYWNLLTKLVLKGETKKAVHLLKSHYDFSQNNQLELVAFLLESMPLSNQYIVHEFCNKWTDWSDHCKSVIETHQLDNNPHLLNIVRLLGQDSQVYEELAPMCETWYQLMVARLLYTDPCIRETDLPELCRRSISIFKRNHPKFCQENSEPDSFDDIIIAAFEYDLIQVLAHCCSYLDDNWWFVTHFIDLLHCSNRLRIHDIIESDKLRETFLQDYATSLFDDEYLWEIGVSYLDNCPTNGMLYLETLLSRVPLTLDDEVKAHKLISIAKKRNLASVCKSVSLLMARKWISITSRLHEESFKIDKYKSTTEVTLPPAVNLSSALYWAVKSGDTPTTTYISDQYLYYYCKTGSFPENSVFDSLRRSPLNNERLAFLAKYNEFKQMLNSQDSDQVEAGNLIKALLASKVYPRFFCQELLEDAKSLLTVQPHIVFQPDNTLDLMRSVEEITKEGMMKEDVELRKNLVRNMARALITPVRCERFSYKLQ